MSRKRLPKTDGEIVLSGLLASVEIVRDQWGVPHIYAETIPDLFFAQGFVHAQDRLWQMELNRRTAQGQLSEVFGELALDTDRATRTFGFNRLGRQDWACAENELKDVILAYTAGVNAFIENPDTRLSIEFSLLKTQEQLTEMDLKNEKMKYLPTVAAFLSFQWNAMRNSFNFFINICHQFSAFRHQSTVICHRFSVFCLLFSDFRIPTSEL